jgi:hypothetical protein
MCKTIFADARAMSERVEALLTSCAETGELIAESQERLADLRLQVDAFRRQCPTRYRPLCDTVDTAGLEVVLRLDAVRYNRTPLFGGHTSSKSSHRESESLVGLGNDSLRGYTAYSYSEDPGLCS